jgi:hypothetical protein
VATVYISGQLVGKDAEGCVKYEEWQDACKVLGTWETNPDLPPPRLPTPMASGLRWCGERPTWVTTRPVPGRPPWQPAVKSVAWLGVDSSTAELCRPLAEFAAESLWYESAATDTAGQRLAAVLGDGSALLADIPAGTGALAPLKRPMAKALWVGANLVAFLAQDGNIVSLDWEAGQWPGPRDFHYNHPLQNGLVAAAVVPKGDSLAYCIEAGDELRLMRAKLSLARGARPLLEAPSLVAQLPLRPSGLCAYGTKGEIVAVVDGEPWLYGDGDVGPRRSQ